MPKNIVNTRSRIDLTLNPSLKHGDQNIKNGIPLIDGNDLWSEDHQKFIRTSLLIGGACEKYGFFQLINHVLDKELYQKSIAEIKSFFRAFNFSCGTL